MADYSVDVHVPNPVNSNVAVANQDGQPFEVQSGVEISQKDGQPFVTDSTFHVPETVTTDSTIHIPETISTDSTFHIPEPIKTESEIDLKPVALDQCLRIKLDPLPATCVRQPYRQHIGFSWLGVEFFGIDVQGEAKSYIESAEKKPHVVSGGPRSSRSSKSHSKHSDGLRIRLGE